MIKTPKQKPKQKAWDPCSVGQLLSMVLALECEYNQVYSVKRNLICPYQFLVKGGSLCLFPLQAWILSGLNVCGLEYDVTAVYISPAVSRRRCFLGVFHHVWLVQLQLFFLTGP